MGNENDKTDAEAVHDLVTDINILQKLSGSETTIADADRDR